MSGSQPVRIVLLPISLICFLLLLAACGDGKDPNGAIAPLTTLSPPATATPQTIVSSSSPAAGLIAFQAFRQGAEAVYLMESDGSDQVRLAAGSDPAWSPDGRRLALSLIHEDRDTIYIVEPGNPDLVELTSGFSPAWSPDGTRLAFSDLRGNNFDLYVIGVDGAGEIRLTDDLAGDFDPAWSPAGERLVFEREGRLYTVRSDGQDEAPLTDGSTFDYTPAWSPDGRFIAFSSRIEDTDGDGTLDYEDDSHLFVVNADGSQRTRLSFMASAPGKATWSQEPAWAPDGSRLAFQSNSDGDWDIYVVKADGSEVVNLTDDAPGSLDYSPAWQPVQ